MNDVEQSSNRIRSIVEWAYLLLVISVAYPKPIISLWNVELAPSEIAFPVVSLLFFGAFLLRKCTVVVSGAYLFFAIYILSVTTATIFASDPKRSVHDLVADIYLVGLAVLTMNVVGNGRMLRKTFVTWTVAMILVVLLGLVAALLYYVGSSSPFVEFLTYSYGIVPLAHVPRLSSTFLSPSMFCNYLTVSLAIVLAMLAEHRIARWLAVLVIASLALCCVFTFSVGLGGPALVVGIWFWKREKDRRPKLSKLCLAAAFIVGAGFLFSAFPALYDYPDPRYSVQIPYVKLTILPSSRMLVWEESIREFRESPIIGHGPGPNIHSTEFYSVDGSVAALTDAHNVFLSAAVQAGLLGAIALLLLTLFVIGKGWKTSGHSPERFALTVAFISAFVYQGMTGAFEDTRHLWILIGLILGGDHERQPS